MHKIAALGCLLFLGVGCTTGSQLTVQQRAAKEVAGCTAQEQRAAGIPDAKVLADLGLQPLLDEGFVVASICHGLLSDSVAVILAKEELTVPAPGAEPACVDACDRDVIAIVDTRSGTVARHDIPAEQQLGIYGEAYDQHCLIDSLRMQSLNDVVQVDFYCGSGESGGMTGWYSYDVDNRTLSVAQVLKTLEPETFDVLNQELVNGFRLKSNAEINQ